MENVAFPFVVAVILVTVSVSGRLEVVVMKMRQVQDGHGGEQQDGGENHQDAT